MYIRYLPVKFQIIDYFIVFQSRSVYIYIHTPVNISRSICMYESQENLSLYKKIDSSNFKKEYFYVFFIIMRSILNFYNIKSVLVIFLGD